MLQRFRAVRKNEGGFTLIELLIVIVILGILTGIVVFAVGAFNDRGQAAACKTDLKSVEIAVEAYKAKSPSGLYPANYAALISGGFLREEPSTTNGYLITLGANGAVNGKLGASTKTNCT